MGIDAVIINMPMIYLTDLQCAIDIGYQKFRIFLTQWSAHGLEEKMKEVIVVELYENKEMIISGIFIKESVGVHWCHQNK